MVSYKHALVRHTGLKQYVKDLTERLLKELEHQFDRFRVPDDQRSVSLRMELEEKATKLLAISWDLLHDTSMSEPTATGYNSRMMVGAVSKQILPTINSLLRSYKKHCVDELGYYLVSTNKQQTWEKYNERVAEILRDMLFDFMENELLFRDTSEGCKRLIMAPLREIFSLHGYDTLRSTLDLLLNDIVQTVLHQPISNIPEGETERAITVRMETYITNALAPPAQWQ
jgi:hypothetical protein